MTHPLLAGFPVVVAADAAWGDMDSFRHLNNVVYFRHFENARVEYLRRVGWFDMMETAGVGPIVAGDQVSVTIDGIGTLTNPVIDRD